MAIMNKIKYIMTFAIGILIGMITIWYFLSNENISVPKSEPRIAKHDVQFFLRSDALKQKVLYSGNENAYNKLYILSVDEPLELHSYDMLYYDMLMAEKYKNGSACHEVYETMIGPCVPEDTLVDYHDFDIDEFRRIGLHYLKLGEQLGDYNCAYTIYELLYYHKIDSAGWKPVLYYEKRADKLLAERW
jgi:hypothetical protein